MCVFCATIPAVMALGVSARSRQNQKMREAEIREAPSYKPVIPAAPVTAAAVVVLVIGSAIVHTRYFG
jgi:hypothetical protein